MTTLSKPRTSQWPARVHGEDCKSDGVNDLADAVVGEAAVEGIDQAAAL